MLVTCSRCATSYEVAGAKLGPKGRAVRCVRCGATWIAQPALALTAEGRADRPRVSLDLAAPSSTPALQELQPRPSATELRPREPDHRIMVYDAPPLAPMD